MARNTSVTLGPHFEKFVSEKIAQGRFNSVSEVVRAGLRKLEEDESKIQVLKEKLQAGENSLRVKNFDSDNFISYLHKKYAK